MDVFWTIAVQALQVVAALSAIILGLWHLSHRDAAGAVSPRLIWALGISALWALAMAAQAPASPLVQVLLSCMNLAWLYLLYGLFGQDKRDETLQPIRPVVLALALVEAVQIVMAMALPQLGGRIGQDAGITPFVVLLGLLFVIGALVLLHNLYAGASPQARQVLLWPTAAMASVWLYDLNLYTIAYLAQGLPDELADLRALVLLVALALLAYGTMRTRTELRFQPSRSFAFRSFSLGVIGTYLVIMVLVAQALTYVGSDYSGVMQITFVLVASALGLAVIPSKRLRGWLKVTIVKNLFQHRYDYRAEWLRFTDTIGRAGAGSASLPERAVQAVADVTESASGLLLTPREEGGLALAARWNWDDIAVPDPALDVEGLRFFEDSQFILDLDDIRSGRQQGIPHAAAPAWLLEAPIAWAMVPLLHFERLVGLVVLSRPPVARMLDWEDFDLLRVIGRQLASYLAEQSSQNALSEAQRFDEFNRRIAFVMHDIKNLASQLSLLARNAEKHADKPEFRADMLITLRNSADKLQALLNRLGRYGGHTQRQLAQIRPDKVIASVARQYANNPQLVVLERASCVAMGDAEGLEQALVHLVQNALDASHRGTPVFIDLRIDGTNAVIEIVDSGSGMSPDFIRHRLFRPFHSSKEGGFGIGAFEARELIRSMRGRLDVESREGIGTRFMVRLPLASTAQLMNLLNEPENPPSPDTSPEAA